MKQKRIEDTLYVFDVTPYTITEDTDAEIIKCQQEAYEGFVELNPDLASKIVKYNYHMFTVNKQEWSDYVDEPDPEPTPEPDPETYIVTYDAGEDDNATQATVTFKSPNPQSEAYLNGIGLEVSENWFNIVSDRLNHLTDEGEDAVISANSGDLKLFFESGRDDIICLGTSTENVYATVGKETSTDTGTVNIVAAPNDTNMPTSALNFVATFDNPWYMEMQTITLTDNEYAQYVEVDSQSPVGLDCIIKIVEDAPNNLTAAVVNDTTSESISLEDLIDADSNKSTGWSFIMPDSPVTITIGVQA